MGDAAVCGLARLRIDTWPHFDELAANPCGAKVSVF